MASPCVRIVFTWIFIKNNQWVVKELVISKISVERKEAVSSKLLPPNNLSVSDVSKQEGLGESTLYNWSSELKFISVVATSNMNAEELSQYCRENGLYIEQIKYWKAACIAGTTTYQEHKKKSRTDSKRDKQQIKKLEKELLRKDKALAETAALLVLRKKLDALLEED